MKKVYTKPLIAVEVMSLDQPFANSACSMNPDKLEGLLAVGLFTEEMACKGGWVLPNGLLDWTLDGVADEEDDTICYHSNVEIAFMS